jgi:hypothetical protein
VKLPKNLPDDAVILTTVPSKNRTKTGLLDTIARDARGMFLALWPSGYSTAPTKRAKEVVLNGRKRPVVWA